MKAIWNGTVIAESDETVHLEGNHCLPPESVDDRYLRGALMRSVCPWKGIASSDTIEVGGDRSRDAAWTYRHPFAWIRKIRDHVSFSNGVQVRPERG